MDQPNCQISQRAARIDAQSWTEMPRTVKPIVVPATTLLVCSAACRMGEAMLFDSHVVGGTDVLAPRFIGSTGHKCCVESQHKAGACTRRRALRVCGVLYCERPGRFVLKPTETRAI